MRLPIRCRDTHLHVFYWQRQQLGLVAYVLSTEQLPQLRNGHEELLPALRADGFGCNFLRRRIRARALSARWITRHGERRVLLSSRLLYAVQLQSIRSRSGENGAGGFRVQSSAFIVCPALGVYVGAGGGNRNTSTPRCARSPAGPGGSCGCADLVAAEEAVERKQARRAKPWLSEQPGVGWTCRSGQRLAGASGGRGTGWGMGLGVAEGVEVRKDTDIACVAGTGHRTQDRRWIEHKMPRWPTEEPDKAKGQLGRWPAAATHAAPSPESAFRAVCGGVGA
jgi:hypothetical protein